MAECPICGEDPGESETYYECPFCGEILDVEYLQSCEGCGSILDENFDEWVCPRCYNDGPSEDDDELLMEDEDVCPECGSSDYDGYCYECGYPNNQGWIGENYQKVMS